MATLATAVTDVRSAAPTGTAYTLPALPWNEPLRAGMAAGNRHLFVRAWTLSTAVGADSNVLYEVAQFELEYLSFVDLTAETPQAVLEGDLRTAINVVRLPSFWKDIASIFKLVEDGIDIEDPEVTGNVIRQVVRATVALAP